MVISLLIYLLLSNAVTSRQDKSILYSRVVITGLLYSGYLAFTNLYIQPLEKGIGIYGGLFNVTCFTQSFNIFLFIVSAVILTLTAFYPRKVYIENYSSLKSLFTSKFLYNKNAISNKTGEQFRIIEYALIIVFVLCGAVFLISSGDLISLFLSIELQSYGLYIFSTLYRDSESATASESTYFLLSGLSSCFILLGSALIYANSGTTNLDIIYVAADINQNLFSSYLHLSLIIMSVGFLFKIIVVFNSFFQINLKRLLMSVLLSTLIYISFRLPVIGLIHIFDLNALLFISAGMAAILTCLVASNLGEKEISSKTLVSTFFFITMLSIAWWCALNMLPLQEDFILGVQFLIALLVQELALPVNAPNSFAMNSGGQGSQRGSNSNITPSSGGSNSNITPSSGGQITEWAVNSGGQGSQQGSNSNITPSSGGQITKQAYDDAQNKLTGLYGKCYRHRQDINFYKKELRQKYQYFLECPLEPVPSAERRYHWDNYGSAYDDLKTNLAEYEKTWKEKEETIWTVRTFWSQNDPLSRDINRKPDGDFWQDPFVKSAQKKLDDFDRMIADMPGGSFDGD